MFKLLGGQSNNGFNMKPGITGPKIKKIQLSEYYDVLLSLKTVSKWF